MILPHREFLEILSVGLLKYYKAYKHIEENDFQKDSRIIYQLATEIDVELKHRFPSLSEHIIGITLFEFPYETFCDRNIDDIKGVSFGTEYIELLIKFISIKPYVKSSYPLLSIDIVPFDGLLITHGMVMNYFNSFY